MRGARNDPDGAPVACRLQQVLGEVGHVVGLGAAHLRRDVLRDLVIEDLGHVGVENRHTDVEQERLVDNLVELLWRRHVHHANGVRGAAAERGHDRRDSECSLKRYTCIGARTSTNGLSFASALRPWNC